MSTVANAVTTLDQRAIRYPWAVTAHPRDQAFDAERSASVCDGSPAALGSPEVPDVAS